MVKEKLYNVWIKLDSTLPWIELEGEYQTRKQARAAAKEYLKKASVKIIAISEKKCQVKELVTVKR